MKNFNIGAIIIALVDKIAGHLSINFVEIKNKTYTARN